MRTFDMTAELNMQVQVPEKFLLEAREACQMEDASPFQKQAQSMYPDDDDEFILMILRNGFKCCIRAAITSLCQSAGIGGSFSPVQVRDRTPPAGAVPVLASQVSAVIPE